LRSLQEIQPDFVEESMA